MNQPKYIFYPQWKAVDIVFYVIGFILVSGFLLMLFFALEHPFIVCTISLLALFGFLVPISDHYEKIEFYGEAFIIHCTFKGRITISYKQLQEPFEKGLILVSYGKLLSANSWGFYVKNLTGGFPKQYIFYLGFIKNIDEFKQYIKQSQHDL